MDKMDKAGILKRAELALESIRPHLKTDGGDIEIIELTDEMVLKVRWLGTCETCSMSTMTMKGGIEHTIVSAVAEIKSIEPINGMFAAE
jgi:Fe-S cluster biogenesis protein NfuA